MLLTVFHPDTMVAHARKHRLLSVFSPPLPPPPEVLPGFPHVLPLLAASLPDPEERLPTVRQLPSGEWLLNGEQLLVGDSATHERVEQ